MLSVMLVEDELLVRTGMRTLVDWEANGFRLAAEAAHGEEALRILRERPIDIVITDIRMPVMDGLELIRRIRAEAIPCELIVLSSFDDFPYVREAMKYETRDYIHKPTMTPDELMESLRQVAGHLASARSEHRFNRLVLETVEESRGLLLDKLIRQALRGELPEPEWMSGIAEEEGAAWICGRFAFALFRLEPAASVLDEEPAADVQERCLRRLSGEAADGARFVTMPGSGPGCLLAVSPEMAEERLGKLREQSGCELWIERADRPVSLDGLHPLYLTLSQRLAERLEERERLRRVNPLVREAVDYMKERFMEPLTLEKVSGIVHVSPVYFSRLFLKETGTSFIDYVTELRVKAAKELLAATDVPVYEISERVGYKNSKYFLRVFKRLVGMTPGEYRDRRR